MFVPVRQLGRLFRSNSGHCRKKYGVLLGYSAGQTCDDGVVKRSQSTAANNLSYRSNGGAVPLVDMTIGQLIGRAADLWPNREAVVSVHQGLRITYREALKRVDKIAAGLRKLGLKPGDRIGIWGPNDLEWYLVFLAASRAGFTTVGINPAYQQGELDYCASKVGLSAVIAPAKFKTQDYASMLVNTKKNCPSLQHIILWSGDHVSGAHRLADVESLAGRVEVETIGRVQEEISSYDPCNIQFTSGTTGLPKAPVLSHRSFVNNGIQTAEREALPGDHHRVCFNVPHFHAFGMIQGLMANIHSGSTLVFESPTFNPRAAIDAIVREKCTVLFGTPTMWVNMINIQEQLKAPVNTLRLGVTGGANASPELIKNMKNILNLETFVMIYGLTETTAVAFQSIPGEPEELTHNTVGHIQHHIEAKVVDDRGSLVPLGTAGELLVRGYSIMMEYYNDQDATAKTIDQDGWLKTGDKFILREDGYGQIVGRLKDMIIRGGENIFPKEIENFLETHPAIIEAQVFGVYDEVYGEEICACVRPKEKSSISAAEIRSYAKGKIAHFKIPRYIQTVSEFPKTTSGKIQKYKLKQELEGRGVIPVGR